MNLLSITGLSCGLTCFVLIFITLANAKTKLHYLMVLINLYCFVWGIGHLIVGQAKIESNALLGWKLCYAAGPFIGYGFYHFVVTFCRLNRKWALRFIYLQAFLLLFLDFFTNIFIAPRFRIVFNTIFYFIPTSFFNIFCGLWGIIVILAFYELFNFIRVVKGFERTQGLYIFVGFLMGFIGGSSTLAPIYKIDSIYPFGNFGIVIYSLIVTYAILKYRLLDIKIVLTRAGIFAVVYFPVVFLPFWIAPIFIHTGFWWIPMLLGMVLASVGIFIYNSLRRRVEAVLLKKDLKKYNTLENFSRALGITKELELDRLTRLVIYRLVKTMGISYGAIYLLDDEEDKFVFKASRSFKGIKPEVLELRQDDDVIKFIIFWKKGFIYEDLPKLMEQKANNKNSRNGHCDADLSKVTIQMERLNARLAIPHFLKDELIGFLVLGEKISLRPYSEADIEVLTTLSRSVGLAITNAISMIKLRNREREFADAARIIEIGNYASGTEHQLGNVLNSIIWACHGLKSDKTIVNALQHDPEVNSAFGKRVDAIITDAKDGGTIVKEIRDYSQQGASKQYTLTNLKEVLDKTLRILYIPINKFQNIDIPIDIATDVPDIMGSPVGLQQVFINIFNNGYDSIQEMKEYIKIHPELGITDYKGRIEVRIRRVKGKVEIHIIDNGKGIQEEVARKLFGPHFTTKGSNEKRKEMNLNGGTGIGLYIMRRIIFDHEGTIALFRSEPLKGADFIIQLPISKQ